MSDKYENAVRDEDGNVKSFTLKIAGKRWVCECRANCLHQPDKNNLNLFKCNGCGTTFETE